MLLHCVDFAEKYGIYTYIPRAVYIVVYYKVSLLYTLHAPGTYVLVCFMFEIIYRREKKREREKDYFRLSIIYTLSKGM